MATNIIKLEWRNSCNLGNIIYNTGDLTVAAFRNKLFLETEIGEADYAHEEVGHPDGDGEFVKEEESLIKNYKFKVVVPEDIADALNAMKLHDDVRITYVNGLYSSAIRNIQVKTTWESDTNECMATVEVSFQQDDQIVKGACCD